MRLATALLTAVLAIGMLADVRAEQRRSTERPGVKTFDTGEIITGKSERMNLMRTQLDLADAQINAYLTQSMLAVQQGHRTGVQHFAVWYRNYEHAKEAAAESVAKEIFKQLLPVAFKLIFPGNDEMLEFAQHAVEGSVAVGEKMLDIPKGDINLFLDRLQAAEEKQVALLLDAPKQFRKQHPDAFEAAKWEYVEMRLEDPARLTPTAEAARASDRAADPVHEALPESVRAILTAIGVPPPGSETATRVAEEVLAFHIYAAITYGQGWEWWPYSNQEFAKAHALHQLDPIGNKKRTCAVQRSWSFYLVVPQRECSALLRQ